MKNNKNRLGNYAQKVFKRKEKSKVLYKKRKIKPQKNIKYSYYKSYKDVKEKSAIAKFKVVGEDAYILAWTTTPWTLPSNVALCVNPEETYVKVVSEGETYYMAEALLSSVLPEGLPHPPPTAE